MGLLKKLAPYVFSGVVALGIGSESYGQDMELIEKNKSLSKKIEKYNQKNRQVYSDFVNFVCENSKDSDLVKCFYSKDENVCKKRSNKNFSAAVNEGSIAITNLGARKHRTFVDSGSDGLDEKDVYALFVTESPFDLFKKSKNLDFKMSKEYTRALKRIMRKENYKGY